MIIWQDVPGYVQILKAFTNQMKQLPVSKYSDEFVNAYIALLSNPALLTAFVQIIFKKTK